MKGLVYKYHRINEFLESLIVKQEIWHSPADSFNDPFEFKNRLIQNNDRIDLKNWFSSAEKNIDEATLEKIIDYWLGRDSEFIGMLSKKIDEKLKTGGVSCFSWRHDNLLMWAHYADNHKGVCLEFNLEYDPEFFKDLLKVTYTNDYPDIDYIKEGARAITKIITTKSLCWSYEEEFRSCKRNFGLYKFNKSALRSIIFGCRAEKANIKRIVDVVKATGCNHINIVQASPMEGQFGLDFHYLDLNNLDQHQ